MGLSSCVLPIMEKEKDSCLVALVMMRVFVLSNPKVTTAKMRVMNFSIGSSGHKTSTYIVPLATTNADRDKQTTLK